MMDDQKQVLKQFKYKPPAHDEVPRERLLKDQEQVVHALEKVFAHCHKVGLQVVSFSDGLVVVPKDLAEDPMALCSAAALGINDYETYSTFAEHLDWAWLGHFLIRLFWLLRSYAHTLVYPFAGLGFRFSFL